MLSVLVACEESQRVCIAFRERGHKAFSCDIQECSGGHPEWHIKDDVLKYIDGYCGFTTQDGNADHFITGKWDLIIAHPPCTYLTNTNARWYDVSRYGQKALKRYKERDKAVKFFFDIWNCNCENIVIENPVGHISKYLKPTQIYNPYNFGEETEAKRTCLWIKGVKPLVFDKDLPKEKQTHNIFKAIFDGKQYAWNDKEVARLRSKTSWAVAKAMAEQWG